MGPHVLGEPIVPVNVRYNNYLSVLERCACDAFPSVK
jgi:hypothetical protein